MEANTKLLKKKRISRMGGKLSKSNVDEPRLPPDDIVSNIMKDMDSNHVVSYKQSQEVVSKKRRKNEGERTSTTQDCNNKCARKNLLNKSFPLMKKCKTSIKHLEKNRCVPKPRAHVGTVAKPQVKPVPYAAQNLPKSKVSKPKIELSQAYAKVLKATNLKAKVSESKNYKKSASCTGKNTDSHLSSTDDDEEESKSYKKSESIAEQNTVGSHLSDTDNDDGPYENFMIIHGKKSISILDLPISQNSKDDDSTDSDAPLIIHRKKRRTKLKQKKKPRQSFSDENSSPVTKITSIPLCDSPESQSEDTCEVKKQVFKKASESYNRQTSSDPPSDLDTYNNSSSDEDLSVPSATLNNKIEVGSTGIKNVSVVSPGFNLKLLNNETDTDHRLHHDMSSIPACLNSIESETMNDTVLSEANSLPSCYSKLTKIAPKSKPCCVRLQRDLILDKKALTLSSIANSSEDDCVITIEDTDIDAMCAISSPTIGKTREVQNKSENFHNSSSVNEPCEDSETDDCLILCMVKSLNSETISCTDKFSSTKSNTLQENTNKNDCENTKPKTVGQISKVKEDQLLNSDISVPAALCHGDGSLNDNGLNIQIVAVSSVTEPSLNSLETNATKLTEVIDLSDDDAMETENSEVEKELGTTEINSFVHNTKSCSDSSFIGSHQNSSVNEPNVSDPEMQEIINSIDFNLLREVVNSLSKPSESETSDCVFPICPGPTVISENNDENSISTNFKESRSNTNRRIVDKRRIENVNPLDSPCKFLKRDDLVNLPDSMIKSCTSSSKKPMESASKIINQTIHRSLNENETTLMTDTNIISTSNYSNIKENISSQASFKSKTLKKTVPENRTLEKKAALSLKPISEKALHDYAKTNAVYSNTEICNGLETNEVLKSYVANNKIQPDSQTEIETLPWQTNVNKQICAIVPDTVNALKFEANSTIKYEKVKYEKFKYEIPETPSDELDILALQSIDSLNISNKKTMLSLINLYNTEYKKYVEAKNTYDNVSKNTYGNNLEGLKSYLEDTEWKLFHLRIAIKNILKHDPCFSKVVEEYRKSKVKRNPRHAASPNAECTISSEMVTKPPQVDSATSRAKACYHFSFFKSGNNFYIL